MYSFTRTQSPQRCTQAGASSDAKARADRERKSFVTLSYIDRHQAPWRSRSAVALAVVHRDRLRRLLGPVPLHLRRELHPPAQISSPKTSQAEVGEFQEITRYISKTVQDI